MVAQPILQVNQLSKSFTPPAMLWQGVSFSLAAHESIAICGQSGSGKSTLLFALGGLEPIQSGTIEFNGQHIVAGRYRYTPGISYVFQHYHLIQELTVAENIFMATRLNPSAASPDPSYTETLLSTLGLKPLLNGTPSYLSGGEQQRVAIARALITQPQLLLADEPTGSLDETTGAQVMALLLQICATVQTGLILVTHNATFAQQTNRQFELKDGHLYEKN